MALAELESLLYIHEAINMLQDSCFCSTRVAEAAYVLNVDSLPDPAVTFIRGLRA